MTVKSFRPPTSIFEIEASIGNSAPSARNAERGKPPHPAGFAEAEERVVMRDAEALRDEAVEPPPHGFARAAEHPLRRFVEKDDALIFINGDNRVHRRGDDAIQASAFDQRPLGLLLIINVRVGAEPLDDLAAESLAPRLAP